ncbi:MAG: hypothetical protein D6767_05205 [Candidatus Hydrogenedentota bacterium]|nr:MAG: hypothetical protein D6767_05205 [Candidatus Hydrogenedentota bacterium]
MEIALEVINKNPVRLRILLNENKRGILAVLSAVFFMHDLSVVSARQVCGTKDNLIDEFILQGSKPFSERMRKKILEDIRVILNKQQNVWDYLKKDPSKFELISSRRKRFSSDFFRLSTENEGTILEIEAPDRPGLLFEISHALYLLYIDIKDFSARTKNGVAHDRFLLQREDGSDIPPSMFERIVEILPKIL